MAQAPNVRGSWGHGPVGEYGTTLPQVILARPSLAYFLMTSHKQTVSWLEAVVELCHHVLWMGEWTGVHPPGMDSSAMLRQALLACWPLHGRTADLLRAVHVQASCPQLLAAWNRQTRAAEQLECCANRACQRGVSQR